MRYLPAGLLLRGRRVLLVGGGDIATRKASLLHKAGAVIDVIAIEANPALLDLLGGGEHISGPWSGQSLEGYSAVVVATSDREVNRAVSEAAQHIPVPVNVVDDPELCTFIIPAIVDRDPLLIGILSSGSSPVLARRIRSTLETQFPPQYGHLAEFLSTERERVADAISDVEERRRFWEQVLDSSIPQLIFSGNDQSAKETFEVLLNDRDHRGRGAVYLIGAGPGDPDLMTFKALRLLQRADVVLYDRLVGEGILDLARRDAEKIYVGKQAAEHSLPQSEINDALLRYAREGKCVARLKGGDPFIFGRGGEEIAELMRAGVDFEVVPGITAASGAACYAGIPLTHRDHAQSVRFVTGHTRNFELNLPWESMTVPSETLVFYMGLAGLSIICRELQRVGRAASTPIAVVEKATTREQRVIAGTLATIEDLVAQNNLQPPTLLIVGDVVTLREDLSWFSV